MGKTIKADGMMDMRGKRFTKPRAVLAYDRDKTVYCKSMAEAMLRYDIPSTSMLERMIENGSTWRGFVTFDWALDASNRDDGGKPSQ